MGLQKSWPQSCLTHTMEGLNFLRKRFIVSCIYLLQRDLHKTLLKFGNTQRNITYNTWQTAYHIVTKKHTTRGVPVIRGEYVAKFSSVSITENNLGRKSTEDFGRFETLSHDVPYNRTQICI
jgi:hypothetical protein